MDVYVKSAGFMKLLFYVTGVHGPCARNAGYSTCGATAVATSTPRHSAKTVMITLKKIPGEEGAPENKFKASLTYPDVSLLRSL
jgi:hypothetical protein